MYVIYLRDADGVSFIEEYRTRTQAIEAAEFMAERGYQVRAITFEA